MLFSPRYNAVAQEQNAKATNNTAVFAVLLMMNLLYAHFSMNGGVTVNRTVWRDRVTQVFTTDRAENADAPGSAGRICGKQAQVWTTDKGSADYADLH
jgi:hypothetical protein